MSKPIFDKRKQLSYIKGKLHLLIYMVDQLGLQIEELDQKDFQSLELEMKKILNKTKLFNYRNETYHNKEKG